MGVDCLQVVPALTLICVFIGYVACMLSMATPGWRYMYIQETNTTNNDTWYHTWQGLFMTCRPERNTCDYLGLIIPGQFIKPLFQIYSF